MAEFAVEENVFYVEFAGETDGEILDAPDVYAEAADELAEVVHIGAWKQQRALEITLARQEIEAQAAEDLARVITPIQRKLTHAEQPTVFQGFHAADARRRERSYGTQHRIEDFHNPGKTAYRNSLVRHWQSLRRKALSAFTGEDANTADVDQAEAEFRPHDADSARVARRRLFATTAGIRRVATKRGSRDAVRALLERNALEDQDHIA